MVSRLARTFGAEPEPVRITPCRCETFETVAVENAIEGCVRETYGALVSFWQARAAGDPKVREVYARIAEDELSTRHSRGAWQPGSKTVCRRRRGNGCVVRTRKRSTRW